MGCPAQQRSGGHLCCYEWCPCSAVRAPAPAPQLPVCPGGGSSSWRCGGLTFEETTYNALALSYPAGCTALSEEALLCSGTLLSPEAQAALGNRSCERACERPQPCAAAAPAPLPEPAPPALGSPVARPAFLTFAQQTAQPPAPGANPFRCPDGASFQVTASKILSASPPMFAWFAAEKKKLAEEVSDKELP